MRASRRSARFGPDLTVHAWCYGKRGINTRRWRPRTMQSLRRRADRRFRRRRAAGMLADSPVLPLDFLPGGLTAWPMAWYDEYQAIHVLPPGFALSGVGP